MARSRSCRSAPITDWANRDPVRASGALGGMRWAKSGMGVESLARLRTRPGNKAANASLSPSRRVKLRLAERDNIHHFNVEKLVASEKPTPARLERVADARAADEVVPIDVVIQERSQIRPGSDHGTEQQALQRLQRAPVDHLLAMAGEGVARVKVEIHAADVLADQFNLVNVAAPEPLFMREANESDRKRIEAHHFRRNGVNGDHVSAGENVVFDVRRQASRTRPVARKRSVHQREQSGMDFF